MMSRVLLTALYTGVIYGIMCLIGVLWFGVQSSTAIALSVMAMGAALLAGTFIYGVGDNDFPGPTSDSAERID